jgi:hypothetical protein
MRLRPTHYTLKAGAPKSWVVEGSVFGASWTEIDRRTDNQDFGQRLVTVSFPVSKPEQFRFIRLTQTDKRHYNDHHLYLSAVEFFGALSE